MTLDSTNTHSSSASAETQRVYWLTREGVILITIIAEGNVPMRARVEIAQLVAAWWRGRLLPRREAPTVAMLLDESKYEELPEPPAPAPIEIAGGAAGLQKHLVALADENRGLDHAALKQLFDEHQVVVAVWRSEDAPGSGFLTLKGAEEGLTQFRRGAKKIRVTMTAIPVTNRDHAELLRQAFMVSALAEPPRGPIA
jgi:hypothetical protein